MAVRKETAECCTIAPWEALSDTAPIIFQCEPRLEDEAASNAHIPKYWKGSGSHRANGLKTKASSGIESEYMIPLLISRP